MPAKVNFQQITNNYRTLSVQERRRAVMRSRLRYGFVRFFRQPWTLTLPLLLAVTTILAWLNRKKLSLPGNTAQEPFLVELWQITLSVFIVALSFFAFLGIIALLGIPHHAKKIDTALAHAGLVDRYGVAPALLHIQPIKGTAARELTFYAMGIAKASWEEREGDICDALNVHFVELPAYGGRKGNNRNYIVLTVAPGAATDNHQPLLDDEFC